MKEMIYRNVDAVWFEIELFKVRDIYDPADDIFEIQKSEYHRSNEVFTVATSRDACFLAETLLTRDDDYNYALIYLCRCNEKAELSEGRDENGMVDERILIGDACSEVRNIEEEI